MGCERRVVYDLVNLVNQESSLHQTLIKDKRLDNLESKRSKMNEDPVKEHLLITRYNPARVKDGQMLSVDDIVDLLAIPLLGIIPESPSVLESSNAGKPVILDEESEAGQAYTDAIDRLLGEAKPHRFMEVQKKGILKRIFG